LAVCASAENGVSKSFVTDAAVHMNGGYLNGHFIGRYRLMDQTMRRWLVIADIRAAATRCCYVGGPDHSAVRGEGPVEATVSAELRKID